MEKKLEKLIWTRDALEKCDYSKTPVIMKSVLSLYFEDINLEQNNDASYIYGSIDSYSTLLYFINDINKIYLNDYQSLIELVQMLQIERTYIVANVKNFDNYILSDFPLKEYAGFGIDDFKTALDILIIEGEIAKKHVSCPYCQSKDIKVSSCFQSFYSDEIFEHFSGERATPGIRLKEYYDELNTIGLSFKCCNCSEEFTSKEIENNQIKNLFITPISKDDYFQSIELLCGKLISKLVRENKNDAKTFYKEDLENIIAMSKRPKGNSIFDKFINDLIEKKEEK